MAGSVTIAFFMDCLSSFDQNELSIQIYINVSKTVLVVDLFFYPIKRANYFQIPHFLFLKH